MKVTITIDTDNEAFGEDPVRRAREVNTILNDICHTLHEEGLHPGQGKALRDHNGNRVGVMQVGREERKGRACKVCRDTEAMKGISPFDDHCGRPGCIPF